MIYLDRNREEPLYMQIYSQIVNEIMDGTLKENQILSGSRGLAKTLGVSRNTVDGAYNQLLAEGYVSSRRGIGYVVMKVPELTRNRRQKPKVPLEPKTVPENPAVLYDLTNSSHTSDLFPKSLWKRCTLECLELLDQEKKLSSLQDKQGEAYLRRNLLSYLQRIRGVRCTEDQLIITAGIQQSLEYICKLLSGDGRTILMEEPGFNKAAAVFLNNDMEVRTVPVDENGLVVSKLPSLPGVRAVYSTPSHQFPTGVTLSIGRRYELLKWAEHHHVYIIEDDFDSEQRYYAKPIPSLQSIDGSGSVIYLGTFSKALSPSIRMGYMILPQQLLDTYLTKFKNYNSTVPLLNQYIIGKLIETGQYDRHIRRLNHVFRKRLELFLSEFSDVKEKIKISSNGTGQYFLLEFSGNVSQQALIDRALEQGVRVYSTMQFWHDKADCPPNTLFLGFSKIALEDITDCVKRLKTAWSTWL